MGEADGCKVGSGTTVGETVGGVVDGIGITVGNGLRDLLDGGARGWSVCLALLMTSWGDDIIRAM